MKVQVLDDAATKIYFRTLEAQLIILNCTINGKILSLLSSAPNLLQMTPLTIFWVPSALEEKPNSHYDLHWIGDKQLKLQKQRPSSC
jgi:hypothetical protein